MILTPNDIRNQEFSTQLRGYEKDGVDGFMEQVASTLDTAKQECLKLSMEIESLKNQLAGLKQFEDTIKNAAIDARRNADLTLAGAKQEAEEILVKATEEAHQTVSSQAKKLDDLEEQLGQLNLTKRSYLTKLRELISYHMTLVDQIEDSELSTEISKKLEENLDVTDSSEMTAKSRETVATQPSEDRTITSEQGETEMNSEPTAEEELTVTHSPEEIPGEDAPPAPPEVEQPATPASEQPSSEQPPLDPELAAALESYKHQATQRQVDQNMGPAPAPQEIVETNARAEDIPRGFIAVGDTDQSQPEPPQPEDQTVADVYDHSDTGDITDKVGLAPEAQEHATEHNAIQVDNGENGAPHAPAKPEELDKSLDEIAKNFDKTVDEATKQ